MEEGIRFWLNSPGSTKNGAAKHSRRGRVPRALGSNSPRWCGGGGAGIKGSQWFLHTNRRKCRNNSRYNFRFYRVCPGSFRVAGFPISWNNKQVMDDGQSGIPRRGWRQGRENLGGWCPRRREGRPSLGSPVSTGWGMPADRGSAGGDLSWRGYFRGGAGGLAPPCTVGSSWFTEPMPSVPRTRSSNFHHSQVFQYQACWLCQDNLPARVCYTQATLRGQGYKALSELT